MTKTLLFNQTQNKFVIHGIPLRLLTLGHLGPCTPSCPPGRDPAPACRMRPPGEKSKYNKCYYLFISKVLPILSKFRRPGFMPAEAVSWQHGTDFMFSWPFNWTVWPADHYGHLYAIGNNSKLKPQLSQMIKS